MACLDRAAVPVKRAWLGLAARLGLRRTTGLRKLKKEVRTCEYRDVHVMWEMLRKTDVQIPTAPKDAAGAGRRKVAWSRFVSSC